ncbi:aldo/keto reductase [Microbacterium protaetiae]|uniref:Aldo/keto reductase n=1 Tax=Microbacterium protaetiae TaxID=2509458 RepID=A0A4P6EA06_9MICO|nr:aldo/keto reductase [Microbacterium protaetiae]QAY58875.1 aldo/keto reductase [Microbacterium protaetiae]
MTATVPRRTLGDAGFEVPALALGSWHTYDRMDFEDAVTLLSTAIEHGVNLFDVGVYGFPGMQPPAITDVLFSAIIRAVGAPREDWLLSEKVWTDAYDGGFVPQLERALLRVGTDHADLVVLGDIHRDDLNMTQIASAMQELVDHGLTRAWGVNNWSAGNIAELRRVAAAEGLVGPAFAQLKYSVARRSIPDGEPFARLFDDGFVFEASDCLEGGYLAGRTDLTREVGRDPGDVRAKLLRYLPDYVATAEKLGTTPARLAIAFTLTHPANVTTLFGATKLSQLEDNIAAFELVEQIGSAEVRAAVDPFWADKDIVDPEGP